MKRIAVSLALATGATLIVAAPAQAAPKNTPKKVDPVKALQAQYTGRTGVKIETVRKTSLPKGKTVTLQQTGVARFGASGPVAWRLTTNTQYSKAFRNALDAKERASLTADEGEVRTIWVRKTRYAAGERFPGKMPENKTWARSSEPELSPSGPLLDVFDPKVLKALLSRASSTRNGVVKGAVTAVPPLPEAVRRQLGLTKDAKVKRPPTINYTLWLDDKGLVTRLAATTSFTYRGSAITVSSDTRYTAWGSKPTIYAPPDYEVIDRNHPVLTTPAEKVFRPADPPVEASASRL